jgi:hypothetical protein
MENDMDGLAALAGELKQIREKLDVIVVAVVGDPSDPSKPGVLLRLDRLEQSSPKDISTRLDRLEQAHGRNNRIFWLMATGIAAAVGGIALQF